MEIDETKEYLDFYIEDGKQKLVQLDIVKLMTSMELGEILVDDKFKNYLQHLKRWVTDAPRKLFYRKMRAEGIQVLSAEQFFDGEGGEEIISKLGNTGELSQLLLEVLYDDKIEPEK